MENWINFYKEERLFWFLSLIFIFIWFTSTVIFTVFCRIYNINGDDGSIGAYANILVFDATIFAPIAAYFFYDNWKIQAHYKNISDAAKDFINNYNEIIIKINKISVQDKIYSLTNKTDTNDYIELFVPELIEIQVKSFKATLGLDYLIELIGDNNYNYELDRISTELHLEAENLTNIDKDNIDETISHIFDVMDNISALGDDIKMHVYMYINPEKFNFSTN